MRMLFLIAALTASTAQAQVEIDKAWARATAPGAEVAGGYMTIRNRGNAPDRLVGASSPAAARVEMHVHVREGEVMKMRQVPAYDVPANGSFELKPGGAHLMFVRIARPFKEGDKVPVKLRFEKAGEVSAEFHVGRLGDTAPPAQRGQ
ncbi:MAG: copper chaperone PCu(A)C [Betaproteobacteria bacterium]|nr:copper chaperone PCu(A)C [Betaproteobacteria bacterium]